MDISIIVVNYNTKDLLIDCVRSIYASLRANRLKAEIIVVDNASSDASVEVVKNEFSGVRVIENNENHGFARANNQGIMVAKGRYVLLLNSDTIVLNDCLSKVLEFADDTPSAGIVGCKVLNPDHSLQFSCFHQPNFLTELVFFTKTIIKNFWDPITYFKYMKYWKHNSVKEVAWLSGCFLLIRRNVFDLVGLLEEAYFMYKEDVEFCYRIRKKTNLKIFYYPYASIIHLKGASSDWDNHSLIKNGYVNTLMFFQRYYGSAYMVIFDSLCKTIWVFEKFVFFIFSLINRNAQRKFLMLSELLKVTI